MKAISYWYIKGRIIFLRPIGEAPIEVIQQYNDQILKLLNKGTKPVHVIIDTRYVTEFPTNLLKLTNAINFLSHPSVGWVITISNNSLISFLGGILPQFNKFQRYRVLSELDKGLLFLKEQDSTLNWAIAKNEILADQSTMA